jgi:RES domain-containing protein
MLRGALPDVLHVEIYRICLAKYVGELVASGNPGRWNLRGQLVIYAAGSRALACLENVVHRSGEGLNSLFKVIRIEVPDALPIEELTLAQMPSEWQLPRHYVRCQPLVAAWYQRQTAVILRVPSSIIAHEYNYVLNTRHPDFAKVKIVGWEDFEFDPRIKGV